MAIDVIRPGLQTTIQDAGRPGYLSRGIPPAGPQDYRSFAQASVLVGNPLPPPPLTPGDPGLAGLEILAIGPTLEFDAPAIVALTGGHVETTLDGEPVPSWTAVTVPAGATLKVGRSARARGRTSPWQAASTSRDTSARGLRSCGADRVGSRAAPCARATGSSSGPTTAGPADGTVPEALRRRLDERPWRDPRGSRPAGPPVHRAGVGALLHRGVEALTHLGPHGVPVHQARRSRCMSGPTTSSATRARDPADIVDDITPVGGIQVPGGIEPIAMGVENPTAGGYAKIGTVISTDLGVLGQIRPMEAVRFAAVDVHEAQQIARDEQADLASALE